MDQRPIAILVAMGANLIIAASQFTAAFFSGSAAMLAQGSYSVIGDGVLQRERPDTRLRARVTDTQSLPN